MTGKTRVLHIGIVGDYPGGMAQVVNRYLEWNFPHHCLSAVATTRRKRDPMSPALLLVALLRLLIFRLRAGAIVVTHVSERGSFLREGAFAVVAKLLGLTSIIHIHGAEFVQFSRRWNTGVAVVLRLVDGVAALTDPTISRVHEIVGDTTPVMKVPNGVSVPTASLKEKGQVRKQVLFAGELSTRKGIDILAEAWARLAGKHPDWELILAGPATRDGTSVIENLCQTRYLGSITNAEVQSVASASMVSVLPSRDEALPMSLIEAMANGCAVVATDVGEVSTLIDPTVGRLVHPDDARALESALSALMDDTAGTLSMGLMGKARISAFYSEEAVVETLSTMWLDISARRRVA